MPDSRPAAIISYSREDSEFALRLARDLRAAGASVWIDQLDIKPGTPWDNAIEDALIAAPQMLVILSPTSVRSENVRDEIAYALKQGKIVIPVLFLDCVVPLRLERKQHIDFRSDYARGLGALLDHLRIEHPDRSVLDKAAEDDAGRRVAWLARGAEARRLAEMRERERHEDAARQKETAERRAIEEAERKATEQADRKAAEEQERKAREEADRKRREQKGTPRPGFILRNPRLLLAIFAIACFALLLDVAARHWSSFAGAKWVALKSGTTVNLISLAGSSDGKILYTCSVGRPFLISVDSGATWVDRNAGVSSECASIFSTSNGKHIWALAMNSEILETSNGGLSWDSTSLPLPASPPSSAPPSSLDEGLVPSQRFVLPQGFVGIKPRARVNRANTLSTPGKTVPYFINAIFGVPDGSRLWAAGTNGDILESDNAGGIWYSRTSSTTSRLNAISGTSDGNLLMAVGDNGVTVESLNGGGAWQEHDSGAKFSLRAIFVSADAKLLCAVGDVGAVRISTDKGVTWTAGQASAGGSFHGVFGTPDGKHLWAVGTSGVIIQSDDSGVTWTLRQSDTKSSLNAIFGASDGKHLWAVGDNGTILESRSGFY